MAGGRLVARGALFSPDGALLLVPHGAAVRAYAAATAAPAFTLAAHSQVRRPCPRPRGRAS